MAPWTTGELAAGVRAASPHELSHLATCETCACTYQSLRAEVVAMRTAVLPEAVQAELLRESHTSGWWAAITELFSLSRLSAALALPALACALWVMTVPHAPLGMQEHVKGSVGLAASVLRDGGWVAEGAPLETLRGVQAGDHLDLQVVGAGQRWVVVQGLDADGWFDIFAGVAPSDGQLPTGVGITAEGETRLRVRVCAHPPRSDADADAVCETRAYSLE